MSDDNITNHTWLVISSPYHDIIGVFDDLKLAKKAVREWHKNGAWSDRKLKWNDWTWQHEIYAYPDFPDDWDEERIATIYRVQVNKAYSERPFGEPVKSAVE